MPSVHSANPEETIAAARLFAASLSPGRVVALSGNLGAGKTHFVKGIVDAWGGAEQASSPTFSLVHEYLTPRGTIHHLDLYRAKSAEEVWTDAFDEIHASHALVVIEWADRFPEILPSDTIRVSISTTENNQRLIHIEP